ncbi:hypothetical protein Tco_1015469 [Tanacetum coccineum]|uniref:Uncharacterized protein n=1 Tax=Tanacetum coccineum TaxID=301880 RepID=A0ABQ5FLE3_9ASTR
MHLTFEKSSLAMTHLLDDIELPKSQPKKTYKDDLECEMVMVKMPRCMSYLGSTNTYDEPIGIAPVAIIDRQLPFEYTIASRSTDVMVMALPVLNIKNLAFRSMFERENFSGSNFNDWFRSLKLVLRVEKKLFVIEQPIPPAPPADSTAQVLAL